MNKLIPDKILHTLTDLVADAKTTFSYSSHPVMGENKSNC